MLATDDSYHEAGDGTASGLTPNNGDGVFDGGDGGLCRFLGSSCVESISGNIDSTFEIGFVGIEPSAFVVFSN